MGNSPGRNAAEKSQKSSSKRPSTATESNSKKKIKKSKQNPETPGAIVEPNDSIPSDEDSKIWVTLQKSNIDDLESLELIKKIDEKKNHVIEIKEEVLDDDEVGVESNKEKDVVNKKTKKSKNPPVVNDNKEKRKKQGKRKDKEIVLEYPDSDNSGHLDLPDDDDDEKKGPEIFEEKEIKPKQDPKLNAEGNKFPNDLGDVKILVSQGMQTIDPSSGPESEKKKSGPLRPRKMRKKKINRGPVHKLPDLEKIQEMFPRSDAKIVNSSDEDDDEEAEDDEPEAMTKEKVMKLRTMVIKMSHEPPPQHLIEKWAGSRPLSDEDRHKFEKYVKLKKGTFLEHEDNLLRRNWEEFCELNDWDKRDVRPFLYNRHNYRFFLPTVNERKKFWRFLGKDLNDRCLYSIFNRFHILNAKTKSSRYSKKEDEFIMECLSNPEMKHKCSTIGKQLGRTNQSVWRRMKILERKQGLSMDPALAKKLKLVNEKSSLKKENKKENELNDNSTGSREEIGDGKKI